MNGNLVRMIVGGVITAAIVGLALTVWDNSKKVSAMAVGQAHVETAVSKLEAAFTLYASHQQTWNALSDSRFSVLEARHRIRR